MFFFGAEVPTKQQKGVLAKGVSLQNPESRPRNKKYSSILVRSATRTQSAAAKSPLSSDFFPEGEDI